MKFVHSSETYHPDMDVRNLEIREKKIFDDLNESFLCFSLTELDNHEDVGEGLLSIEEHGKEYRHIHVELKAQLGEDVHDQQYEEFPAVLQKIRDYQKEARLRLKNLKSEMERNSLTEEELKEEQRLRLEEDKIAKVRSSILVEESVLHDKFEIEIEDCSSNDKNSLEDSCVRLQKLLDEYFALISRAKIAFGKAYAEQEPLFEETKTLLRNRIKTIRSRIVQLTDLEKDRELEQQAEKEKLAEISRREERSAIAVSLADEIEYRSNVISEKCDSLKLDDFDDFKILDLSKGLPSIDIELREILAKFTEFSQVTSRIFDDDSNFVVKIRRVKEHALKCRNLYAMKLHSLMETRDINEEKLKKSLNTPIELEKFSGFESKMDIYTFRSEFERLVQPRFQNINWLDALRRNHLSGPALSMVEQVTTIDEAWEKLFSSFGDVRILLQNKLSALDKVSCLEGLDTDEKMIRALTTLTNIMIDLSNLAAKHNLECKLYIGGGFERVISIVGPSIERKFFSKYCPTVTDFSNSVGWSVSELESARSNWNELLKYLQKELSVREKLILVTKSKNALGVVSRSSRKTSGIPSGATNRTANFSIPTIACHLCGQTDHILSTDLQGNKHCDYFSCKFFVELSPARRCSELIKRKFCLTCLSPGVIYTSPHKCHIKYVCPDASHKTHPNGKGLHVLVCEKHRSSPANINLLQQYVKNFVEKRGTFHDFTRKIALTVLCFSNNFDITPLFANLPNVIPDSPDRAIFLLQTINVDGVRLRIFYDRGAGDAVLKWTAVQALQKLGRAVLINGGTITMAGVGDMKSVTDYGLWSICLPLKTGYNVVITGVCMEKVTSEFPQYDLTDVERDIRWKVHTFGGDQLAQLLPKLPAQVGGETDILLGSKYLRIHPREMWRCEDTGLTVSDSLFLSVDGSTGVLNGPHPKITEIEHHHWEKLQEQGQTHFSYYTPATLEYRAAYERHMNTMVMGKSDAPLCGTNQKLQIENALVTKRPPKCVKTFDEIDTAGIDVSFRCVDCRNCDKCRKSGRIDAVSIQEEVEQHLIEKCVTVDVAKCRSTTLLPFVAEPDTRIDSDSQTRLALKIYECQTKALERRPEDREAAILQEKKLHDLGFVEFLENLSPDMQDLILNNVRYVIPWRIVLSETSVSTPCRIVFDASASPRGQCSLNSLLCKGTNNINNLLMIIIRWVSFLYVFHTDISKMYNTIYLDSKHWRYQLYFWDGELKVGIAPKLKVILTNVNGVRSSGNVAECALRRTADLTQNEFPSAYPVIKNNVYVDDCLSGNETDSERCHTIDQFSSAVAQGGFNLKGFTLSGMHPPENMANKDGISVTVGGIKWYSKDDIISLNISEHLSRAKRRSKRSLSDQLTRRDCVRAVYQIFEPLVVPHVVKDRGKFSKYSTDSFKFQFTMVVRIIAWVLLFITCCLEPLGRRLNLLENLDMRSDQNAFLHPNGATLVTHSFHYLGPFRFSDEPSVGMGFLKGAIIHFFLKATLEVRQFSPASDYLKKEQYGSPFYTGRILPLQNITRSVTLFQFNQTCFQLNKTLFQPNQIYFQLNKTLLLPLYILKYPFPHKISFHFDHP